jgi:hypothetical protein
MKTFSLTMAAFFLLFGAVVSRGAVVTRISSETGVPVATLQSERATTGLGWGELEKAHLLANASGKSFDSIVAMHKAGEGWGKIAHQNGLNLGRIVSNAHRPEKATLHSDKAHGQNVHGQKVHGVNATARGHTNSMNGFGRGRGGNTTGASHGMSRGHGGR